MRSLIAGLSLLLLAGCDQPAIPRLAAAEQPDAGQSPADPFRLFRDRVGNFYAKTPSPDGRYLTEIDWDTGDLAIQDAATGEIRRVTNKGPWSRSNDYAEAASFSPDGKRIVYTWFSQAAKGYELRVINVDGSGMRVLRPASDAVTYFEPRWSPDGMSIAATVYRADRANQVAMISPDDGSVRVLKTVDWRAPFHVTTSPDGRYVAYDFPPEEDQLQRDVYVLATDGGRETRVVSGEANEVFLGWLPDGSGILYYSDRAIRQLPLREGRPAGPSTVVRADVWNLIPQGMTERGLMYGVRVSQRGVRTLRIDLANGRAIGTPEPIRDISLQESGFGAWSPDGSRLAYTRTAGLAGTLVISEPGGREAREIPLRITDPQGLQWAPDGQSVYLYGTSPRQGEGLYRVDLQAGATELVMRRDQIREMSRFELAPDGKSFYVREHRDSTRGSAAPVWVTRYPLDGGDPVRLQPAIGQGGRIGISPDGRWMAYGDFQWGGGPLKVMVAPVEGGAARVVYTFPDGQRPIGNRATLEWSPDGKYVLFPEERRADTTFHIRAVPVDGGDPITLLTSRGGDGPILDLRLSPDGRRLVYTGGMANAEMWLLPMAALAGSQ